MRTHKRRSMLSLTNEKLRDSAKKYKNGHGIDCGRLGLIQLKLNGLTLFTTEESKAFRLRDFLKKLPHLPQKNDIITVELHKCTTTQIFTYDQPNDVWLREVQKDGLF